MLANEIFGQPNSSQYNLEMSKVHSVVYRSFAQTAVGQNCTSELLPPNVKKFLFQNIFIQNKGGRRG